MKRPEFPNDLIGARIKTSEREGTIELIGNLSDDPWVLFDDNNVPTRCSWENIGIAELEEYMQPSCATCKHAFWEKWYNGETHDVTIGCKFPHIGDLGSYTERWEEEILYYWHDSCTDYPQECEAFSLVF